MAKNLKFTNVGYFAVKKSDPKGRQVVLTKSIEVEIGADGKPKPLYIQMYDIKQGDKQDDEQFAALKKWKLKDLVIVTEQ